MNPVSDGSNDWMQKVIGDADIPELTLGEEEGYKEHDYRMWNSDGWFVIKNESMENNRVMRGTDKEGRKFLCLLDSQWKNFTEDDDLHDYKILAQVFWTNENNRDFAHTNIVPFDHYFFSPVDTTESDPNDEEVIQNIKTFVEKNSSPAGHYIKG